MNRVVRLVGNRDQQVVLVGGILGLRSDAELVASELQRPIASVLLGIPFEDLDAIHATSGNESQAEFEASVLDEAYLKHLAKHGPVQTPPPDLYLAFRHATEMGLPIEAIDMGDEAHTDTYTKHVGMLEVMRSNRIQKRLIVSPPDAGGAEEFAVAWDRELNDTKGLRRLQALREEWMTNRLRQLPSRTGPHLALVPLPRLDGIVRRLREAGYRDAPETSAASVPPATLSGRLARAASVEPRQG